MQGGGNHLRLFFLARSAETLVLRFKPNDAGKKQIEFGTDPDLLIRVWAQHKVHQVFFKVSVRYLSESPHGPRPRTCLGFSLWHEFYSKLAGPFLFMCPPSALPKPRFRLGQHL